MAYLNLCKDNDGGDDEEKSTSDTETVPDENIELVDMKRRFTLVTAEEPIPSSDEEHLNIIATIPPIVDGTLNCSKIMRGIYV